MKYEITRTVGVSTKSDVSVSALPNKKLKSTGYRSRHIILLFPQFFDKGKNVRYRYTMKACAKIKQTGKLV